MLGWEGAARPWGEKSLPFVTMTDAPLEELERQDLLVAVLSALVITAGVATTIIAYLSDAIALVYVVLGAAVLFAVVTAARAMARRSVVSAALGQRTFRGRTRPRARGSPRWRSVSSDAARPQPSTSPEGRSATASFCGTCGTARAKDEDVFCRSCGSSLGV